MFCLSGGVSSIFKRLATSNSPQSESYNDKVEPSELIYLDANNLYGFSMCKMLPERDFEWMTCDELQSLNPLDYDTRSEYGMILEVQYLYSNIV